MAHFDLQAIPTWGLWGNVRHVLEGVDSDIPLSVSDFGAVGDGTTDDTQALADAFAAAEDRMLRIPEGTYLTDTVIDVPANCIVEGAGRGVSVLKWADNAGSMPGSGGGGNDGTGLLNVDGVSGAEIRRLTIDCNKDNQGGTVNLNGAYLRDVSDVVIEQCTFRNITGLSNGDFGNGVRVHSAGAGPSALRLIIKDSTFHDILVSYPIQFSQYPEHCHVLNNTVYDCTYGFDFSTGNYNTCSFNVISDVNSGASNVAINMQYGYQMTVVGNVIENCTKGISGHFQRSTIAGNFIYGKNTSSGVGIDRTGDSNGFTSITGNRISRFQVAVQLTNGSDDVISGNSVEGCPTGINLTGTATRVNVTGNGVQGAGTASVALGASTEDCAVTANMLSGSTGALSDSGTGNTTTPNY